MKFWCRAPQLTHPDLYNAYTSVFTPSGCLFATVFTTNAMRISVFPSCFSIRFFFSMWVNGERFLLHKLGGILHLIKQSRTIYAQKTSMDFIPAFTFSGFSSRSAYNNSCILSHRELFLVFPREMRNVLCVCRLKLFLSFPLCDFFLHSFFSKIGLVFKSGFLEACFG